MRTLMELIPIDRVLFASNCLWEEKGSGIIQAEEWEKIAWKNVAKSGGDVGKASSWV